MTSAVVISDQVLLGANAMDLVIDPRSLTLTPNPDSPNIPASLAMGVRS